MAILCMPFNELMFFSEMIENQGVFFSKGAPPLVAGTHSTGKFRELQDLTC